MTCKDAPEMLRIRREISANKNLSVATINEFIRLTNEIRWRHEEESPNCGCWQKARREADGVRAA
jgi:hypothetical protein